MSQTYEVLITVPIQEHLIHQLQGVSSRLKIHHLPIRKAEEIPPEVWEQAEILYTDGVLPEPEMAPSLRWIQFHWAGIDHVIQHPILRKPEVISTTLSGAAASQMAEYAVMMMLALGHRLPDLLNHQRSAEWPRDRWERFTPIELRDATVGIVGYGSVGRQIAFLLKSFGATVLATKRDPRHPEDTGFIPEGQGDPEGDLVYRLYPSQALKSMLRECDFIVITVPLTKETRKMVGQEEIDVLKPTAFLIDISRGGVVDSGVLLTALRDKKIGGAALDVHSEEPLPSDNPLWKLPNVIITPHISGITKRYNERAIDLFTENLNRYLNGTPLLNKIDPERGY
jgi:phosphoglycerate dehydrogenase-like enzyme